MEGLSRQIVAQIVTGRAIEEGALNQDRIFEVYGPNRVEQHSAATIPRGRFADLK